jgi:uncharacterized membrane protein YgcG
VEELVKSDVNKAEKPAIEPKEEAPPLPIEADRSLSTDVETSGVPTLLRWLGWILAVAVIAVLLVFFARWLYHATHHAANPAPATSHQKSPASSSQSKTSGSQPANGTSSGGASSSSSGSPAGSSSGASSNSQITNTGPGNVVAVFAISSLATAGLHFIISLRRQARS